MLTVLLDTRLFDTEDPRYARFLSAERRERIRAMGSPLARREGFGAELALCLALRLFRPDIPLPPEYRRTDRGKPYDPLGRVHFSLTHSGGIAACAVSDGEVAVDLEASGRDASRAEPRVRCPEDDPMDFLRLWTAKECAMKYTGLGFALSPGRIWVRGGAVYADGRPLGRVKWFAPNGNVLAVLSGDGEIPEPVEASPSDFL